MRATVLVMIALCIVAPAAVLVAQSTAEVQAPQTERPRLDREAMQEMTFEERRAYLREFRQARRAWAEAQGLTTEEPTVQKLETPLQVEEKGTRAPGTSIQYDTGTAGYSIAGFNVIGNRFDSALNAAGTSVLPVESSGTLTQITFYLVNSPLSPFATWTLFTNINTGAATANPKTFGTVSPVATGLNTTTVNQTYQNGAFVLGILQTSGISVTVGLDSGQLSAQGFHAVSISSLGAGLNDLTAGQAGGAANQGLNAIVRVSGDVAVPVELMNFTID